MVIGEVNYENGDNYSILFFFSETQVHYLANFGLMKSLFQLCQIVLSCSKTVDMAGSYAQTMELSINSCDQGARMANFGIIGHQTCNWE
jgi:hypothetical protein